MSSSANNGFFDFANNNSRRSFVLLGAGAIIGLMIAGYGLFTAAGTATNTVPPEYIAVVNQRPIYRSDYLIQLQATFSIPYEEATAEQRQKILDDMINEELLVERGLEADLVSYDPDVRNTLVAGAELQMYADVLAKQPSDAELHAWYDQHREQYSTMAVLRLRDLVLDVISGESGEQLTARAQATVAALRAGKPVDAVMQQYKLHDSLHLQQAGKPDLDDNFEFAVEAKLPKAVFKALQPLQAGEISEPVNVNGDGTHIVVMMMRRQSEPLNFEDVRSNVWTDIKNAEQEKVRNSTLNYLRSKSQILIGKV